jgi:hypothetical protein
MSAAGTNLYCLEFRAGVVTTQSQTDRQIYVGLGTNGRAITTVSFMFKQTLYLHMGPNN